ncbi:MAG: flagellar hook-length control protein FliK [Agathobacter sp.]
MTGTNVFSLNSSEVGNHSTVAAPGGKSKAATEEAASVFASMMNQNANNLQASQTVNADSVSEVNKTEAINSSNEAYDRYQYKQNNVENRAEKSDNSSISEKIDSAKEDLNEFEENVMDEISEKMEVSIEDIQNALDELGLTVFDLLNPKNLATVVAELTGATNTMELLVSTDFQELLGSIGQMGSDLMKQLNIQMDQIDELVMQMNTLDENQMTDINISMLQEENAENVQNQPMVEDAALSAAEEPDDRNEAKVIVEDLRGTTEDQEETSSFVKAVEESDQENSTMDLSSGSENGNRMMSDGQNVLHQNLENAVQGEEAAGTIRYSDIDVFDMIEQVARNVRVVLESDVTSMEMQLNPENLGKIYLHVSSKEGTVHAQIAAQNEIVKEALEMQVATLRENLSQAGVKVDSVEVTIASHEFERNLEQNEQGQQQNPDESKKAPRRNLKLDSLDELSGLMSEEEALVAQIMRDNGNSVDFTA